MGVADQIVASRFSSIDLSNKALQFTRLFALSQQMDIREFYEKTL